MPRLSSPDTVEALLDGCEAIVDCRLELRISENIRPVVFDAFANEFTDIEGIDAVGDPLPDHLDARSLQRCTHDRSRKPLRDIPPRVRDLRANEARTQNGHSDS